jgi:hypothetical protein
MHYTEQHDSSLGEKEVSADLLVEDVTGQILLTLFDSVIIDEVTIVESAKETLEKPSHTLHLYARCPHRAFPANPDEVVMTEFTLEHKLGCALLELFDTLEIVQVEVRFMPTEHK